MGSREKYLNAGFDEYISKPINRKVFFEIVDRFINGTNANNSTDINDENTDNTDNTDNTNYLIENGIDYDKAIELLGDKKMYDDTLNIFLSEIDTKLKDLKQYMEDGNPSDYSILAHSLKSDSKYLGFTKLADMALDHELKGKDNDIEFIRDNYSSLEDEVNRVINITKDYLGSNRV